VRQVVGTPAHVYVKVHWTNVGLVVME